MTVRRDRFDAAAASLARALMRVQGEAPQDAAALARDTLAYEIACHEVARVRRARLAGEPIPTDATEA